MATQPRTSSHTNSLKVCGKGYLRMKKKQTLSKWYKRYCELDGPQLKYFDHFIRGVDDNVARGLITLEKGTVVVDQNGSEFSIKSMSGDTYIFQGTSGHDARTWVNLINDSFKTAEELKEILGDDYKSDQTFAARVKRKSMSRQKIMERIKGKDGNIDAFDVVVPEGFSPGMKLNVEYQSRSFVVTIPDGIYTGQVFEVRLNKANPVTKEETIQHAGWMYKHARTGMSAPKKKWFILTDFTLSYMDDEGMSSKMVWTLADATAMVQGDSINFTSAGETLKFGCGTSDNARTWMNRLQLCMNAAKGASAADVAKQFKTDSSFVGKVVTGKALMSGWVTKHATHNLGVSKPKLKWFLLNQTHLVYSDFEGQAVKREWKLAECAMIYTKAHHVVLMEGDTQTLQLSFELISESLKWSKLIGQVIALHQTGYRNIRAQVPMDYAGAPTIPVTIQVPVPAGIRRGQTFSLFFHNQDMAVKHDAEAPDSRSDSSRKPCQVAVMCNGMTKLIAIPPTWDGFQMELEGVFALSTTEYTVANTDGMEVDNIQELRRQHEVVVTVNSNPPTPPASASPSRAAAAASSPEGMQPAVVEWLAKHNLSQHKSKLIKHNVTTISALTALKSSDVSKMGFTAIAARKFLKLCSILDGPRSPTSKKSPTRSSIRTRAKP